MNRLFSATIAALLCLAGSGAWAAEAPAVQGVVTLSASASLEVARDVLNVTLSVTREGSEPAAVQTALKQALDAALLEAKKLAKPGQLEVQTGNFTLYPRYAKQSLISGWQGSAELIIEGRDMPAIAALTGRITSMTVARVGFSLSRDLREKLEGDLAAQAIARYRAKAADYAKQFGYSAYTVREVNVTSGEPGFALVPMLRGGAMSAPAGDQALPVEAGKGTVTVTVSGSVQLMK